MEHGIKSKPITLGNPTYNAILEWIHWGLGNLWWTYTYKETYIDEDDPRSGILSAAELSIHLIENRLKYYSPGQLLFGHDMIILIKPQ